MHATGCANGRNTQHTSDTIVGINTFAFKPIQHHIVKAVLENINPNKAQRCDFVLPRAVKACSSSIEKPFCDLLNSIIISCSQVPDTWKCGQITPLHKKSSVFCIAIYHQRIVWLKLGDTWTGMVVRVLRESILGPLLFNIFMNDLNFAIEKCNLRVMRTTRKFPGGAL